MLRMADLSKIVSVIEIEGVRLREANCRTHIPESEIADEIVANVSHATSIFKKPDGDGLLVIHANFSLEIRADNEEGESVVQAEVQGLFELSYKIPDESHFSSDELEAFGEVNAVFNAWPYWREWVQTSLARMALPPLTIPVYRVPKTVKDGETDSDPE